MRIFSNRKVSDLRFVASDMKGQEFTGIEFWAENAARFDYRVRYPIPKNGSWIHRVIRAGEITLGPMVDPRISQGK